MKIINLNFYNQTITSTPKSQEQNSQHFGLKLNTLTSDVVSFGTKNKKDRHKKHSSSNAPQTQKSIFEQSCVKGNKSPSKLRKKIKNSMQCYNPQEAEAKRQEKLKAKEAEQLRALEAKIEYEHKKAETKKKYINPNLQLRIKERIISDKELIFIINRIQKYPELINETFFEPNNGELLFYTSDYITQKLLSINTDYNKLLSLISTEDKDGKIFMERIPISKLSIFNETLSQIPNVLISAYLTPNKQNQLPAHYLPLEGLKMMNETLKDYPTILAQIYTHVDKIGNTPMHNRFRKGQSIIKEALSFQPETLSKIRKTKNRYDEYPDTIIKKAQNYDGPYKETWQIILNEL